MIRALTPQQVDVEDGMVVSPSAPNKRAKISDTDAVAASPPRGHGKVASRINQVFKGALPNSNLCTKVQSALSKKGFGSSNTLVATSFCCDEVNRELDNDLTAIYGYTFNMGGLAGFPFGGATSFGAMAHHIPDGGSCIIAYGPHVGVDADGKVGKVNRRGKPKASGTCCGSAADALNFVGKVQKGEEQIPPAPKNAFDAAQTYVRKALIPRGERVKASKDEQVELPHALFDCQDDMMKKIVREMCGEVEAPGKIALLGGIQINTPIGMPDFFLPRQFLVMDNEGELEADLMWELTSE